jgi:integrase/recombinase XerD
VSNPSQVRVRGVLEAFAPGFAGELRGLGYTPVAATFQLQLMAHASRWLDAAGLGPDAVTSDVVERFLAARRAAGYTNYVTAGAMAPLLDYLRAIGVAPAAVQPQPRTPAGFRPSSISRCRSPARGEQWVRRDKPAWRRR